jgi:hypothetical protein
MCLLIYKKCGLKYNINRSTMYHMIKINTKTSSQSLAEYLRWVTTSQISILGESSGMMVIKFIIVILILYQFVVK